MDVREVLIDGIGQLNSWLDDALAPLTPEQLNWLPPEGKMVSAGFSAWHVLRTEDNIANFVFQKTPPVWMAGGYFEKMNLPKVDQGTGMSLDAAREIRFSDVGLLREYGRGVAASVRDCIANMAPDTLEEIQMVRPLGEMPRWKVFRQVFMTHGFMHLGEVNALKGMMGMQFAI
jgi:hypothetical protein